MEEYGRFEQGKPLVLRIGSGKVDEDQRMLMILQKAVSTDFLDQSVADGLAKVIRDITDEQAKECLLNEDGQGGITTAPLQAVKDSLYDGQNMKSNVYIASASPNGVPRVHLGDRLRQHVAFVKDDSGQEYNLLNLVVNTEKDIQGSF